VHPYHVEVAHGLRADCDLSMAVDYEF
jgi:hypothetical protein